MRSSLARFHLLDDCWFFKGDPGFSGEPPGTPELSNLVAVEFMLDSGGVVRNLSAVTSSCNARPVPRLDFFASFGVIVKGTEPGVFPPGDTFGSPNFLGALMDGVCLFGGVADDTVVEIPGPDFPGAFGGGVAKSFDLRSTFVTAPIDFLDFFAIIGVT